MVHLNHLIYKDYSYFVFSKNKEKIKFRLKNGLYIGISTFKINNLTLNKEIPCPIRVLSFVLHRNPGQFYMA